VTWGILGVCATVFALQPDLTGAGLVPRRFWRAEAWAALGAARQIAPLPGHVLVHADAVHLVTNLWCLYLFGSKVEGQLGRWRYAALFSASALGAAAAQLALRADTLQPMVGASGAVAGVLACYALLFPRARVVALLPVPVLYTVRVPALALIGAWALLQLLSATATAGVDTGVAWWAHVGGLVVGAAAVRLLPDAVRLDVRARLREAA